MCYRTVCQPLTWRACTAVAGFYCAVLSTLTTVEHLLNAGSSSLSSARLEHWTSYLIFFLLPLDTEKLVQVERGSKSPRHLPFLTCFLSHKLPRVLERLTFSENLNLHWIFLEPAVKTKVGVFKLRSVFGLCLKWMLRGLERSCVTFVFVMGKQDVWLSRTSSLTGLCSIFLQSKMAFAFIVMCPWFVFYITLMGSFKMVFVVLSL